MARSGRGKRGLGAALAVLAAVSGGPGQAEDLIFAQQVDFMQLGFRGGWNGRWGGPVLMPMPHHQAGSGQLDGFSVAGSGTDLQDTAAGEALRLMEAGDWLKAIQAIESLSEDEQGMVTDPNGIYRPLASMKSALIATMPEEGRRVFRKLNNPSANTKLAQAKALEGFDEQARAYESLIRGYGLCDAAAQAALHLGDMRFERGRFAEAAVLYRFSAEHPGSVTESPMLVARRLVALSRAGQWAAFDKLTAYAELRYGDTAVELGGQPTKVGELITQLNATRGQAPAADHGPKTAENIRLPESIEPDFEIELIDKQVYKNLMFMAGQNQIGQIADELFAPRVVAQDGRLFCLALGGVARLDPETGTELWRVGDPESHANQLRNRMYHLPQGYHQSLVAAGQTLLAVVPQGNQPNKSNLLALDAETGEQKWDWHKTGRDHRHNGVVGEPLVVDGTVYFVTHRPGNPQLKLVAVRLSDGGKTASVELGSCAVDENMNGAAELSPRLVMGEDHLFVLTNNGALIAVGLHDHQIAWAFSQRIRPSGLSYMRNHGFAPDGSIADHTGQAVTHNGLVIAKDTRSNRIHAFKEHGAVPAWQAETENDATIVHADASHVYVLGRQLTAHDITTGEPVWWTPFAGKKAGQPLFTADACLIAGSSRTCRVDLRTGKLTSFTEDVVGRAELVRLENTVLRVSRNSIAGYTMPD